VQQVLAKECGVGAVRHVDAVVVVAEHVEHALAGAAVGPGEIRERSGFANLFDLGGGALGERLGFLRGGSISWRGEHA
jgi:hypothetical protein